MPAPAAKCPNRTPVAVKDSQGRPLRYSTCPACGGNFAVLASGLFRTHRPIYKPGNPRIAENVAAAEAAANGAAAPIKHL